MDQPQRFIGLAFVIAWTIFRLVRYLKAGSSRRASPPSPAAPGITPPAAGAPAPPAATASPIEPAAGGAGFTGALLAVLVLLLGNAVVWGSLFLVPQLDTVPVILRLVIGVLANFYLLYLARGAAAWARRQPGQGPPAGGNPIS